MTLVFRPTQANVRIELEHALNESEAIYAPAYGPFNGPLAGCPADEVAAWFKMILCYVFTPRIASMVRDYGLDPLFDVQLTFAPTSTMLPIAVVVRNHTNTQVIRLDWLDHREFTGTLWVAGEKFDLTAPNARQAVISRLRHVLAGVFGDPE